MAGIYERFGITPIVNARGTHTRLGGTLMHPEVVEAMQEASTEYVVLSELQAKASELIARATGAPAGMVTGGAAGGLLLGAAACIAGNDPEKIEMLPDTTGMKNQAIMHRAHRNGYDHSIRAAGAEIVEVGFSHATLTYQLEVAFTEQTALVVYLISPWASHGALSLEETCRIAHGYDVPVLVDAAAGLPPADNLTRFISEGADLVTFSGGKGLRGPQSSGILAGRTDLIEAAALNGSPNHSVGRTAKASKEDIVGLMVALELYLERDHAADLAQWRSQAKYMARELGDFPGVEVNYRYDGKEHPVPRVELVIDREATGIDAHELVTALENESPRVYVIEWNGPSAQPNNVTINTSTMQEGEEKIVAEVLARSIRQRIVSGGVLAATADE